MPKALEDGMGGRAIRFALTSPVPCYALIAVFLAVAVADIVWQARAVLFQFDEVVNADAAVQLFRYGDYTSKIFGELPFNPTISSGIATTWIDGLVLVNGGSLFSVRVFARLAQLGLSVLLIAYLLWCLGITWRAGLVMALAVWLALLLTMDASLRTGSRGELWSALWLACGVALHHRAPVGAAFLFGVSVWLGKVIYLPIALALLFANVFASSPRNDSSPPTPLWRIIVSRLFAFLLPLLLWMFVIGLVHGGETVARWVISQVIFTSRHAVDLVLPLDGYAIPGWRFAPTWGDQRFLSAPWSGTSYYLIPLGLAAVIMAAHQVLVRSGFIAVPPFPSLALRATAVAMTLMSIWFFAFDPSQWGRHLLPVIFAGCTAAIYAVSHTATQPSRWSLVVQRFVVATTLAFAAWSSVIMVQEIRVNGWKASYSTLCVGPELIASPCMQYRAAQSLLTFMHEICPHVGDNANDVCLTERRARFMAAILARLEAVAEDPDMMSQLGYLIRYFQQRSYSEWEPFAADLRPILCDRTRSQLVSKLDQLGLDLGPTRLACDPASLGQD